MFTNATRIADRERSAAHSALVHLIATGDDWFDGTPSSVDRRISTLRSAFAQVRRVASVDPEMMQQAERLDAEINDLHSLRSELLSASHAPRRRLPRLSSLGTLSQRGREFVASELRTFLAENADALDDPDELDVRAEDHAEREIANFQMPLSEAKNVVAHFRLAVDWAARNAHRSATKDHRPQRVREASVAEMPDDALFD
ncbi:hypothetical protein SEA_REDWATTLEHOG_5 [Gordonia phage RedWattleHog]|uniref:Uncharacterized protein n=1 Tax=Gordonia phage Stormageddon TaxID=2656541 RepID=A0A649VRD0_9CAUD|nr:hypothetical protein KHQ86_gp005 [Gordonia phage Stormageddon]QGJ94868.1 hypothetical protein SEA_STORMAGEDDON_5 [Gordonia phage Stormageddon]QLF83509.1 hypothetical protein SEA_REDWATTLEHOG_5 [Gordonia phage RedWattleHog]